MKPRKPSKPRSRQKLPNPADLFSQPPVDFYRLPEFEMRQGSLVTQECSRVLEFTSKRICLDMGRFTVTFYGEALQIESLAGKRLILTGQIRHIDLQGKWGDGL